MSEDLRTETMIENEPVKTKPRKIYKGRLLVVLIFVALYVFFWVFFGFPYIKSLWSDLQIRILGQPTLQEEISLDE